MTIPQNKKEEIAAKLHQGISHERIIDDIRESIDEGGIKRHHLLEKKDLHNISCSFGLQGARRHANDQQSVHSWITEWKQSDNNPVLFHKLQGQEYSDEEDLNLTNDDFMVILQSHFQKTLAQKFAHKGVCCDATHGTTAYDFKLTTLLVIDEFGEGVPVAWCLSTHEDFTHMCVFFKMIKRTCGPLQPRWFMSDIAPQFYNAWVAINGNIPQHLYCTWHVDKAWREELRKKVGDLEMESQVYKMLRTILEQPDEKTFDDHSKIMIEKTSENEKTTEFLRYYTHDWLPKRRHWAYYHRAGLGINTNMFVEAFHRVFKYNYLNGKHNKRVDVCLLQLVKFARDMAFKRAIKLLKHKDSYRLKEIKKRHQKSLELPLTNVTVTGENAWNVKSATCGNNTYNVSCAAESCPYENCQERCIECNVCVHQFDCNCPDSLITHTICKHIHLVGRHIIDQKQKREADKGEIDINTSTPQLMDDLEIITETLKVSGPTDANTIKQRIQQQLLHLMNSMNMSNNTTALKQLEKSLNTTENLFISLNKDQPLSQLETVIDAPANKKIEVQKKFYSTAKKRKKKQKVRYAKPTQDEKKELFAITQTNISGKEYLIQNKKIDSAGTVIFIYTVIYI